MDGRCGWMGGEDRRRCGWMSSEDRKGVDGWEVRIEEGWMD